MNYSTPDGQKGCEMLLGKMQKPARKQGLNIQRSYLLPSLSKEGGSRFG